MAVESRFVVIRNGVEAKTFMDKKSADEYDKMLDMADNLSQMFAQSTVTLSDNANEELSIFLAEHREEVLVALLAKKPTKAAVKKPATQAPKAIEKTVDTPTAEVVDIDEKKPSAKPVAKAKKTKAKVADEKLSEAG